jgi:protocatechuate 3,4-dioxygenase beta subunit
MAGSSHIKRVAVIAAVVAAAAAVVVVAKCGTSSGKSSSQKVTTTGGTSAGGARGTRAEKPDPRTIARVAIHGHVRAKGGGPIAGAQVCTSGSIEHVPPEETRDPKCTLTDPQGAYGFDELYAGTYWVSASAATYKPAGYRGPAPDRRGEIRLEAGARRDDVDIVLDPGGVEVKGTVSDINGGPIAEAWVSVSPNNWYSRTSNARVRTAADGTFTAWVGPGPISGSASADGYAPGRTQGVAPTTRLDILLTPESVLAGTVVEAEGGAPVPGATVYVQSGWGGWSDDGFGWGGGGEGSAITDEQGRFRITRLSPGRYKPKAEILGRYGEPAESVMLGLGQTVEGVVIPVHDVQVLTGRIVIDDGAGRLTPCEHGWVWIHAKRGDASFSDGTDPDGSIRLDSIVPGTYKVNAHCDGYLEEDEYPEIVVGTADVTGLEWKVRAGGTIAGVVRTRAGAPVPEIYVTARTVGGDPRGQRSWEGESTEDDGTFTLKGLAPGEYQLEPTTDKHPTPRDPVKVTVAAGKATPAEIVLDDGGSIAGVVVDDQGTPVADARVNAQGDRWEWRGMGERTRDDGTFTIEGLAAGSYRVQASRGWSDEMRKPGTTDDDVQGERTTVAAGQTAHVRIVVESRTGTIAGVVVDTTGAPIPDAYLSTERESDAAGAIAGSAMRSSRWGGWDKKPVVTDQAGAFKVTDLSPGNYTIRAYRRGGGEAFAEHIPVGTKRAKLVMKPTGSIAGVVKLKDGRTPDDISVAAADQKVGFSRREGFFRTAGAFKLAELPAGTFVVTATAPEGHVETTVTLAEGEAKTGIVLELEARVTVVGRIVALDDGTPVPGMQVSTSPIKGQGGGFIIYGGDDDKQAITAADGKFRVEDAPAGRVYVQAWPIDWENSKFSFIRIPRTLAATGGEIDVGDLKVPRRRTDNPRDRGSDLGFDIKQQPPDIEPEDAKIEVSRIRPDGPAVKSGLEVGDVITSVDGTDVSGANSYLAWAMMEVPVGTVVKLGLARGATVSITTVPEP